MRLSSCAISPFIVLHRVLTNLFLCMCHFSCFYPSSYEPFANGKCWIDVDDYCVQWVSINYCDVDFLKLALSKSLDKNTTNVHIDNKFNSIWDIDTQHTLMSHKQWFKTFRSLCDTRTLLGFGVLCLAICTCIFKYTHMIMMFIIAI